MCKKGKNHMHTSVCMHSSACCNRAGVTPAASDSRERGSGGNVSDTCRRDRVDILLLLKKHQSGCCRQRLACSNARNNRNHGAVWTRGLVFFTSGEGWEVFGVLKQNEGLTVSTRTGRNGARLHAMWTQKDVKDCGAAEQRHLHRESRKQTAIVIYQHAKL